MKITDKGIDANLAKLSDEELDSLVEQGKEAIRVVIEAYIEMAEVLDVGVVVSETDKEILANGITIGWYKSVFEQGFRSGVNASANLAAARG